MIEIALTLNDGADLSATTTAVLAAIAGVDGVTLSEVDAALVPAILDLDSSDDE